MMTTNTALTHTIDDDRFAAELTKRGWTLDSAHGWVKFSIAERRAMEKDWREALLASVKCPHEKAGAE